MMVAEGTGRNLAPEANMWLIARPLIEGWMRENLGPEARIKDAAEQTLQSLKRLPTVLQGLESALSQFDEKGLKLHPDTVRQLRGSKNGQGFTAIAMISAAALIAIIFAAVN